MGEDMDKIYYNQNISCNVFNCVHCNDLEEKCMLSNIKINTKVRNASKEKETFCESFEASD